MRMVGRSITNLFALAIMAMFFGCSGGDPALFTHMDPARTGISFTNTIRENDDANVLNYAYFYNGGGVAIGDINNDGLQDILFTGNMAPNRLYLNKGNFNFEDITQRSGIAAMQGWCTGATMADVNGDGLLDIYICRSGDIDPARRRNLLFINNGELGFTEQAMAFGLADEGYSTQAAFVDYDKDGDLDLVVINHSLQQYANAAFENAALRDRTEPAFATKLYRNDGGHYTDVSVAAGIVSNVLSFGLGLAISDLNNDGWPDIYVSNDFNEPDHLYINNHNGTFTERLKDCMDACSLYSMGSDCADVDNDGLPDLLTLDMLAEDNHTQKMHSGAENFDKFQLLFRQGFYFQYSRNMLQKNNGDGTFSEIGQLAGISNTDWSWSPLFADFDNDGNKDLYISNGYARDFTDMDFIKYHFSHSQRGNVADLLGRIPSLTPPDYVFRGTGGGLFEKKSFEWGLNDKAISSGAAYADLDNDGAMDLIVSRINDKAVIYRNGARTLMPGNHFLRVKLEGAPGNSRGIGAKIKVYCGRRLYFQEEEPVRGFQSSVDPVLNFGIGTAATVDSLVVIWPDDKVQVLHGVVAGQTVTIRWREARAIRDYGQRAERSVILRADTMIGFIHRENAYNDLALQPLLSGYLSRPGPGMAKADVDGDGREDIFISGGAGQAGAIFLQKADGRFMRMSQPGIAKDSATEVASAIFFDADSDGDADLYTACGGYELAQGLLQDHLYLNDGDGKFTEVAGALPEMRFPKACVRAADVNGDGAMDLFVGGRVVPGQYPLSPGSRILLNDGHGRFRDGTTAIAPVLAKAGMVTDAVWADLNGDKAVDLVVVGEWMPVSVWLNKGGRLVDVSSEWIHFESSGWWNTIKAEDMDGDGDPDLVIGNLGLNTQLKASATEPMSLYYKDFDGNGILDPILCYYINGISYPAVSRDDLVGQLPLLKKKFLEYHAYADATIRDIFTSEQLKDAGMLKATCLPTVYLENRGQEGFVRHELPVEAQYGPVYAIGAEDIDHDGKKDLLLAGNNSWVRIRYGKYNASHGVLLKGDGHGGFSYMPQWESGLMIRGDVRSLESVQARHQRKWIVGVNDGAVSTYTEQ